MPNEITLELADEQATLALGEQLAKSGVLDQGAHIYLRGQLGAGKTTLVRGLLTGLGCEQRVLSPTYTLVQTYDVARHHIVHFDLYRLRDPEELEYLGVRDYFHKQHICLVEWPEKGAGVLPQADLDCYLRTHAQARTINCSAHSPKGDAIIAALKRIYSYS